MSFLENNVTDITNEELRSEIEKMKIKKARLEELIRKIEQRKSEMLLERKEN